MTTTAPPKGTKRASVIAVVGHVDRQVRRLALKDYSEEELIEELARRKNERVVAKPKQWCDQCVYFKTLPETAPESSNPCIKGHKMQFELPDELSWTGNEWGFYRRVCGDRQELPDEDA